MVYEKSARGYTEFTNPKRTLGVRERQVLLLVNGSRDLEDLEKFFKKEHLMEMLQKLEAGNYIQVSQAYANSQPAMRNASVKTSPGEASSVTPLSLAASAHADFSMASLTTMSFFQTEHVNAPVNAATINPATMEAVKTILIEATEDYLGLMGRGIRSRISACDNEIELRNCISSWHMAMRESKLGRESTSFLLQQIHHALENQAEPTDLVIGTDSGKNEMAWSANPGASEHISAQQSTATLRATPTQKFNAPEPLGFLQNAFG